MDCLYSESEDVYIFLLYNVTECNTRIRANLCNMDKRLTNKQLVTAPGSVQVALATIGCI